MNEFTEEVIKIIGSIPSGKVMSYGGIAKMANNAQGARQVTRILHTMSKKHNLPWHRVINSKGKISIPNEEGANEQRLRLIAEGVEVSENFKIDLSKFQWI